MNADHMRGSVFGWVLVVVLNAIGVHSIWQGIRAPKFVIPYSPWLQGKAIADPKWYHRVIMILIGCCFLLVDVVVVLGPVR